MQLIGPCIDHRYIERPVTDAHGYAAMTHADHGSYGAGHVATMTVTPRECNASGSFQSNEYILSRCTQVRETYYLSTHCQASGGNRQARWPAALNAAWHVESAGS